MVLKCRVVFSLNIDLEISESCGEIGNSGLYPVSRTDSNDKILKSAQTNKQTNKQTNEVTKIVFIMFNFNLLLS